MPGRVRNSWPVERMQMEDRAISRAESITKEGQKLTNCGKNGDGGQGDKQGRIDCKGGSETHAL